MVTIPLLLIFISMIIIVITTSILTRKTLLENTEISGFDLVNQITGRIQDNSDAIDTINGMMEDDMRILASVIIKNREKLSNEYLDELAASTSIDNIYWYKEDGEMIYSTVRGDIGWIPGKDHPLTIFSQSNDNEMMEDIRQDAASANGDYFKFGAIKSPDGSFVQLAVNANKLRELTDRYNYQHLVEELAQLDNVAYASFLDPNGIVLADVNKETIGNQIMEENLMNLIKK